MYAASHLSADRWYKLGRELMYGRLEDEKPFHSVRRLVQQEDYMLRLFRDNGLPTAAPHGVAELTPEREYLLLTEFFDGAVELGEVEVDDEIIDAGLAIVRRLWDAGVAHRDIKPSNLLVRGQQVLLIDVAFAELRPTPWRQAVDLANMMLCLALRSSPERVYQRAQTYFTLADIGEAFAAARGLALPSQLRRALRAEGRDLHAEFLALLPARPQPVRIQRWSTRRVALWVCVAFGVFLLIQNRSFFTLQEAESADLDIPALECSELPPMWLQAQAVPSASLVPCTGSLADRVVVGAGKCPARGSHPDVRPRPRRRGRAGRDLPGEVRRRRCGGGTNLRQSGDPLPATARSDRRRCHLVRGLPRRMRHRRGGSRCRRA